VVGLIGEAGPEAIVPLKDLKGGGGGVTVIIQHVSVAASSPREFLNQLERELKRKNVLKSGVSLTSAPRFSTG
jgi:hypothetical protein